MLTTLSQLRGIKMASSAMRVRGFVAALIVCYRACSTNSIVVIRNRIFFRKFMSTLAVRFLNIHSGQSNAALNYIDIVSNGVKVDGIDAMPPAAKMIKFQPLGNRADKHPVRDDMRAASLGRKEKSCIAVLADTRSPQPARRTIPHYFRVNFNLREKANEKIEIYRNAVRIVRNHLSLLFRFDGLGFRGLTHREALSF